MTTARGGAARRTYDGLNVSDITLQDYIAVKPKDAAFLPHSAARYQTKRFRKAQVRRAGRRRRVRRGGGACSPARAAGSAPSSSACATRSCSTVATTARS